ncbi:MAG: ATP-dependent zinc metalloprotease FtsH [Clostridia bacterium]
MIILGIVLIASLLSSNNAEEINYAGNGSVVTAIKEGKVSHIQISGDYLIKIRYNTSKIEAKFFPNRYDAFAYIPDRDAKAVFEAIAAAEADPTITTVPSVIFDNPGKRSMLFSLLLPLLSVVLIGIVFFIIYRQSQGQNNKAMNFGKTKARVVQSVKVRFNDVAGAEEEKEELQEIVDFLKSPKKFIDIGARIPRGVLLVGPPGTGKTLFAKAVAGEANVPFFSISGSDFVEMFVGVGASRVRDLFEQAKHNMPCIIFIDEIDAVGRQRGTGLGGGHDEREQTLNQLLVQMDGFEKNEGIIIMAATNRADILDPALLRPGRFDRQIYVHIPDVRGREAIFKVHARNKPLSDDIDFKNLARLTSGFTGADIENLLNEAAILAARANRKSICMADINEGINKVIAGPQKKSRVVTEHDKRITAYHESGHAIVARLLAHCDEVNEVSIIPRGMAAGYTITRPDNDDNHVTRGKLMDNISMLLAGRVAEEIVLKDISTGASNDIQRASSIARKMVTEWGMSSLGTIFLGNSEHEVFLGRDFNQQAMSPETAAKVDAEMKKILDECYGRSKQIISDNRNLLDNMVKVLFEKETIFQSEVDMLFEGKSPEEIIAISNAKALEKLQKAEEDRQKAEANEKAALARELEEKAKKLAEAKAEAEARLGHSIETNSKEIDKPTDKKPPDSKSDDSKRE